MSSPAVSGHVEHDLASGLSAQQAGQCGPDLIERIGFSDVSADVFLSEEFQPPRRSGTDLSGQQIEIDIQRCAHYGQAVVQEIIATDLTNGT